MPRSAAGFSRESGAAAARRVVHGGSQELVDARLIAFPLRFEPGENVGVEADGERLLDRAIEFPDDSGAPITHLGGVGQVYFPVGQGSQRGQLLRLFLRYLLHRFFFL
jgi:hypothetical protein